MKSSDNALLQTFLLQLISRDQMNVVICLETFWYMVGIRDSPWSIYDVVEFKSDDVTTARS